MHRNLTFSQTAMQNYSTFAWMKAASVQEFEWWGVRLYKKKIAWLGTLRAHEQLTVPSVKQNSPPKFLVLMFTSTWILFKNFNCLFFFFWFGFLRVIHKLPSNNYPTNGQPGSQCTASLVQLWSSSIKIPYLQVKTLHFLQWFIFKKN